MNLHSDYLKLKKRLLSSLEGEISFNLKRNKYLEAGFWPIYKQFKTKTKDYTKLIIGSYVKENLEFTDDLVNKVIKEVSSYFNTMNGALIVSFTWLEQQSVSLNFDDYIRSCAYGVFGYRLMDLYLDEKIGNQATLLTGQLLIHEHEVLLLKMFGVNEENYHLLHIGKLKYFIAEIKEKLNYFKSSPYDINKPEKTGDKAFMLMPVIALGLLKAGKIKQLSVYEMVFQKITAILQIADDYEDIEEDVDNGHYSFVYIVAKEIYGREIQNLKGKEIKKRIYSNKLVGEKLMDTCNEIIDDLRNEVGELDDKILKLFIEMITYRINIVFTFKISTHER